MPYTKIWIHLVWSTKYRVPSLSKELRPVLFDHILGNAISKKNLCKGYQWICRSCPFADQVEPMQNIARVVQLLKGESSNWINKNGLTRDIFEWQNDYYAISVSESVLPGVIAYIERQEIHHEKKTFSDECKEFLDR